MPNNSNETKSEMTLWEHLQELRSCLIRAVLGIVAASIISYIFWRDIWRFLTRPINNLQVELINTAPIEAFITSIKVAIISGIVLSSPWILWNFWRFVAPGLFENEKKMIYPILFSSVFLFLGGAAFAYFTVLPFGLKFLADYTLGEISANWRQGEYATFVLRVLIAFGATFELPVISYVLTKMGVINARTLWSFSRYALIIIFIAAAFLTPPDPITQILLAVPLVIIYGISILISHFVTKKEVEV